ncbi:MAG: hypothetical protein ABFS16_14050 [Bacteroidota bacterium]
MNPLSVVGAFIITLSLLAYGIGSISLMRFKIIGSMVLIFLSLGVLFDITAVTLMIMGSKGNHFTPHGVLGYSALLVMLIDVVLIWRTYFKKGLDTFVSKSLEKYSRIAFLGWVAAYITGSLMVLWR